MIFRWRLGPSPCDGFVAAFLCLCISPLWVCRCFHGWHLDFSQGLSAPFMPMFVWWLVWRTLASLWPKTGAALKQQHQLRLQQTCFFSASMCSCKVSPWNQQQCADAQTVSIWCFKCGWCLSLARMALRNWRQCQWRMISVLQVSRLSLNSSVHVQPSIFGRCGILQLSWSRRIALGAVKPMRPWTSSTTSLLELEIAWRSWWSAIVQLVSSSLFVINPVGVPVHLSN